MRKSILLPLLSLANSREGWITSRRMREWQRKEASRLEKPELTEKQNLNRVNQELRRLWKREYAERRKNRITKRWEYKVSKKGEDYQAYLLAGNRPVKEKLKATEAELEHVLMILSDFYEEHENLSAADMINWRILQLIEEK